MRPGCDDKAAGADAFAASLDQSLKRLRLDYVDIFYHHRPDPDTPMEESLTAVADAVRSTQRSAVIGGQTNFIVNQTKIRNTINCAISVALMLTLLPLN